VIGDDLLQSDDQALALRIGYLPAVLRLEEGVGGVHPVEWFVGATVGVDRHASVGLDHDQTHRFGEMGGEAAFVVNGATSDDESHGLRVEKALLGLLKRE
jgi:hypothetical protein